MTLVTVPSNSKPILLEKGLGYKEKTYFDGTERVLSVSKATHGGKPTATPRGISGRNVLLSQGKNDWKVILEKTRSEFLPFILAQAVL